MLHNTWTHIVVLEIYKVNKNINICLGLRRVKRGPESLEPLGLVVQDIGVPHDAFLWPGLRGEFRGIAVQRESVCECHLFIKMHNKLEPSQ